jgi:hypothetical protein
MGELCHSHRTTGRTSTADGRKSRYRGTKRSMALQIIIPELAGDLRRACQETMEFRVGLPEWKNRCTVHIHPTHQVCGKRDKRRSALEAAENQPQCPRWWVERVHQTTLPSLFYLAHLRGFDWDFRLRLFSSSAQSQFPGGFGLRGGGLG